MKRAKFILIFFVFLFLSGCLDSGALNKARQYSKDCALNYKKAEKLYNKILKSSPRKEIYFELGRLYYDNGDFLQASRALNKSAGLLASKYLAISYYRMGDFTAALEVFTRDKPNDNESLYYYGLTCEKLNLFDQALDIYRRLSKADYFDLAQERIGLIERKNKPVFIKDIDPKTAELISGAPSLKEYPQASVLNLLSDEKMEITSAGKEVVSMHYIVKVLNDRGKENASEATVEYDSTYEKVELEYARTIKPDGSVVEVGNRHIRDVSKYLNFPLYSNVRVFIISFPEIAVGSTIEYKLKVYGNKLINDKDFVSVYPVQSSDPVINAAFQVEIPKGRELNIKTINTQYNYFAANLQPEIKTVKDKLIYLWRFNNIPQIIPEAKMPSVSEINPTIVISSFNSWQDIYNWWWKQVKEKIAPDSSIKEKVASLTKGLKADLDKARAIYNFCAKDIRYVAVEYGQAGYEPHQAADIFRNKYGDCKDQAVLLVAMLKEAGLSAWPVLIATREYIDLDDKFPAVLFNHCIAAVSLSGETVFMDPTAQTCSFMDLPADDQKRRVLVFKEGGFFIENTPFYPAQHNLIKQRLSISIAEDESMQAERDVYTYGLYDQGQRYWLLYTMPDMVKEYIESKIQTVSIGAKLLSYDIKNLDDLNLPVELNYKFQGPEYLTLGGNLRIMPQLTDLDLSLVAKAKRNYPLDFVLCDIKDTETVVNLPDNLAVKYLPQEIREDNNWLSFYSGYEQKGNSLYFKQRMELKKSLIPREEYLDFKAFFEKLAKRIKQRVVLEKKK